MSTSFFLAFAAVILAAISAVFAQKCSLNTDGRATNADVLVLGAGMSGVAAARTLEVNGIEDFIVLEAEDRIGGRVREFDGVDINIELGANWISGLDLSDPMRHPNWREWAECDPDGPDGSPTPDFFRIYDDNGTALDIDNENGTYRKRESDLYYAYENAYEQAEVITEDISVREALTNGEWEPQTVLDNFTDWVYFDYCDAVPPKYVSLLRYTGASEGDYVGTGEDAEAVEYYITDREGFSFLPKCIARNFKDDRVILNSLVIKIQTASDCVCVTVQEDKLYCASYAIVTFSIGALQATLRGDENSVQFEPPLPKKKQDAINEITVVNNLKFFLQFENSFWDVTEDPQQVIGYVSNIRGYYPAFIIVKENQNILQFDVTGELALKVANQSVNMTRDEAMEILRTIYGNDIPEPSNVIISNFTTNPRFLGTYTTFSPGVPESIFDDILEPVNGRLYFAGDSLNRTHYGFTHGAYGSGVNVGREVFLSFQDNCEEKIDYYFYRHWVTI